MTQEWFTETSGFFGERCLRMYENDLPTERTEEEVEFILSILDTQPGARVLDVPCGHGRHAIAFAQHGYEVTGYELNKHFLEVARKEADKKGMTITWLQGDMREINFNKEFDVALNLFTAMGYFEEDADDQKFLDGVYRALRPGGEFILDYLNAYRLLRNFKPQNWEQLSDSTYVLHEREFDVVTGTMHDTKVHLDTDGEYTVTTNVRFYTPTELIKMLQQSGFTTAKTYGDFTGSALTMDAKRLIIHARKG